MTWNLPRVLLCFVLLWLYYGFIVDPCDLFIYIPQSCFTDTGPITSASGVTLKDKGGINFYQTTTKHNKAGTMYIFHEIFSILWSIKQLWCFVCSLCLCITGLDTCPLQTVSCNSASIALPACLMVMVLYQANWTSFASTWHSGAIKAIPSWLSLLWCAMWCPFSRMDLRAQLYTIQIGFPVCVFPE